jgi:hypothetical protein
MASFADLNLLRCISSCNRARPEKLKDSKGRLISTIIAAPLTENEAAETNETSRRNQNQVLAVLQDNNQLSLAQIAEKLGWYVKSGKPNRSLVYRTSANAAGRKTGQENQGANRLLSHSREIAPFRQARNLGKRQNTVHCIHCTVRPGSGSAVRVARRQNPKRGLRRSCPDWE